MSESGSGSREAAIVQKIKDIIDIRGISQRKLAEQCRALGYSTGQSSISKILAGNARMTVENLEMFSKALDVPMEVIVAEENEESDKLFRESNLSLLYLSSDPSIDKGAFEGYVGEYQVYFLASSSTEKGQVKDARLKIELERDYCRAQLKLEFGDSRTKSYEGQMLVSSESKVAYLFMLNHQTGELISLYIRYRRFHVEPLMCRLGLVLSSGSGDSVMPTVGYLLLTRKEIREQYKQDLAGILKIGLDDLITVPAGGVPPDIEKKIGDISTHHEVLRVDRQKLIQKLLTEEEFEKYLKILNCLSDQAWSAGEQVRITESIDLEIYKLIKLLQLSA